MSKRVAIGLLALILVVTYANHFQNSFHFDDAHTIVNNAAIRSLENIPRFFTDARTFSSLPSNQSYRPLVSTLLAIDYRIGGPNPLAYHLSIFALFLALIFLIAVVILRLLDSLATSPANRFIAFGAAALFGLHPANADTVNYIIASAEIISTLGVVASFAVYFQFPKARRYYFYALPSAIAILAKPPAAIFAVLFGLYRALPFNERQRNHGPAAGGSPPQPAAQDYCKAGRRAATLSWLGEVAPTFVVCVAALLFVQRMTPHSWVAGARNVHDYLLTQPYVALLYFKTFFWPSDLSADYDLNSITTMHDPRFWIGIVFVVLLLTMSILCARSKR